MLEFNFRLEAAADLRSSGNVYSKLERYREAQSEVNPKPIPLALIACQLSASQYGSQLSGQNDIAPGQCAPLVARVSQEPKRPLRIYLDSGWPRDNYEPTRSMRDRLLWKGYQPSSEIFYLAFPNARHDENAWAERSPIPFQFLFGKQPQFSSRPPD